jgi:hypothetical protein
LEEAVYNFLIHAFFVILAEEIQGNTARCTFGQFAIKEHVKNADFGLCGALRRHTDFICTFSLEICGSVAYNTGRCQYMKEG